MLRRVLLAGQAIALAACGKGEQPKPDLPTSVSPGWSLKSFEPTTAPSTIPTGHAPVCWLADYEGHGSAKATVCRYTADAAAFDAVQRTGTTAQMIKFQEGSYLILVQWDNVPKADLTTLIRALQKALKPLN